MVNIFHDRNRSLYGAQWNLRPYVSLEWNQLIVPNILLSPHVLSTVEFWGPKIYKN